MLIRSAFWVGKPMPGQESAFCDGIDRMVPAMRALPGVAGVKALWPERREDAPPDVFCQLLVEFDNPSDCDRMLASAERLALRPRVKGLAEIFDGTISHIDYRVG